MNSHNVRSEDTTTVEGLNPPTVRGYQRSRYLSASPSEVYHALTQRIPEWWSSDFEGAADHLGGEFTVRFGSTFKTFRITKAGDTMEVDWLCVAQRIVMPEGMAPLRNDAEWVGQTMRWILQPKGAETLLIFFHEGLTTESECWSICESGWDQTLQSLALLLESGTGRPFQSLDDEHLARATANQQPTNQQPTSENSFVHIKDEVIRKIAPRIADRSEWLGARIRLLEQEKELTRQYDRLCQLRRELPWVRIEKNYLFEGPNRVMTLGDLFADKRQLIIQHFMFGPGWKEGCVGCSFTADHVDAANLHLQYHDVSLVVVSRATWPEIERFQTRMGWKFLWVSSFGSEFNYDFHVSFTPEQRASGQAFVNYRHRDPGIDEIGGHSVFYKDTDGSIYHTYSTFNRGDERLIGAYNYLDLTPLGRNENGPNHDLTDWVRHHDRYGHRGRRVEESGQHHPDATCVCSGTDT
ncbi:MAG: DUF899 family protein [Terrimicrobiaceae bacterium]|nr:DUF899 family protein [Terrimicrobiaceae bacterium]